MTGAGDPPERAFHAVDVTLAAESRPYLLAITSCPSALNGGINLLKHEPSAQIPWTKTMLGLADMKSSRVVDDDRRDARSTPRLLASVVDQSVRLVFGRAISEHFRSDHGWAVGRGPDHVEHGAGPGEHREVAALNLIDRGAHAPRHEAVQFGVDGTVALGHDVRTRLAPPRDAVDLLAEQVRRRRSLGRPEEFFPAQTASAAKHSTPAGSIQTRPSAISMCEKTSVTGNWSCWLCEVSSSSGASAAM